MKIGVNGALDDAFLLGQLLEEEEEEEEFLLQTFAFAALRNQAVVASLLDDMAEDGDEWESDELTEEIEEAERSLDEGTQRAPMRHNVQRGVIVKSPPARKRTRADAEQHSSKKARSDAHPPSKIADKGQGPKAPTCTAPALDRDAPPEVDVPCDSASEGDDEASTHGAEDNDRQSVQRALQDTADPGRPAERMEVHVYTREERTRNAAFALVKRNLPRMEKATAMRCANVLAQLPAFAARVVQHVEILGDRDAIKYLLSQLASREAALDAPKERRKSSLARYAASKKVRRLPPLAHYVELWDRLSWQMEETQENRAAALALIDRSVSALGGEAFAARCRSVIEADSFFSAFIASRLRTSDSLALEYIRWSLPAYEREVANRARRRAEWLEETLDEDNETEVALADGLAFLERNLDLIGDPALAKKCLDTLYGAVPFAATVVRLAQERGEDLALGYMLGRLEMEQQILERTREEEEDRQEQEDREQEEDREEEEDRQEDTELDHPVCIAASAAREE